MQTLLIVNSQNLAKHSGEEYSDYMEFDFFLSPDQIEIIANKIRNKVRELALKSDDRTVDVYLDVTPPYKSIVVGLAKTMNEEEKIQLKLPEELNMNREEKLKEIEFEQKSKEN